MAAPKIGCTPGGECSFYNNGLNRSFPAMRAHQFLPEKGVMLNADFPQPLGSSVVRKLKTYCAFKLLILEKERGNINVQNMSETGYTELPEQLIIIPNSFHYLKLNRQIKKGVVNI